jgi:hypothetical protein
VEHCQHQHRPVRDPLDDAIKQFARTRVDPVKVAEHRQQRLPPRKKGRNLQQTNPATPHLRRRQQLTPMTERGDAYFLEVIGGQIGQQSGIDVILAECRLVAF